MVVNKGTWRGARQYNFAEEYRRKKAAQQKRLARECWARIRKMMWWPTVTLMIAGLAALIVWRPLQSVQINSVWAGARHLPPRRTAMQRERWGLHQPGVASRATGPHMMRTTMA